MFLPPFQWETSLSPAPWKSHLLCEGWEFRVLYLEWWYTFSQLFARDSLFFSHLFRFPVMTDYVFLMESSVLCDQLTGSAMLYFWAVCLVPWVSLSVLTSAPPWPDFSCFPSVWTLGNTISQFFSNILLDTFGLLPSAPTLECLWYNIKNQKSSPFV